MTPIAWRSAVHPVTGTTTQLLAYFDGTKVKFRWSFPHYNDFDYTLAALRRHQSSASNAAKSVARTGPIRPSPDSQRERQVRVAHVSGFFRPAHKRTRTAGMWSPAHRSIS